MMATLLQSFSATSSTWVEKKMAAPFSVISRMCCFRVKAALGSNPTKGSSRSRSLGSSIRAPISASFCFMPWEKAPTMSLSRAVMPKASAYLSILACLVAASRP